MSKRIGIGVVGAGSTMSTNNDLLSGKTVVVTGGGRGIGAAISKVLAAHGAAVAVVYSQSQQAAEAVVANIENSGGAAAAFQAGPDGITVNMVSPGWMVTEKVDPKAEHSKKFASGLPLRRHGDAEEIGNACVFFLSELAGYITGAYLPVTGGRITQMGA